MDLIIETTDLTRRFGRVTALEGLDLRVERGELLAVVGPDGAGKTTTLRLLCGLLTPSAGTVRVAGLDVARRADELRRHVGYAAQSFSLYPDLTVAENIAFFARVYGVSPADEERRTRDLLAFSNLERARERQAGLLSGGMKQKLALVCALIHEPNLLLLDEPTTGVDPVSRRELWRILAELHARGKTILLSTPYMDEAERCGRVALLDGGHLVALDAPEALQRALPGRLLSIETPGLSRGALLAALATIDGAAGPPRAHGLAAHLPVSDAARAEASVRAALAAGGVTNPTVRLVAPSLEDVFIARAIKGPATEVAWQETTKPATEVAWQGTGTEVPQLPTPNQTPDEVLQLRATPGHDVVYADDSSARLQSPSSAMRRQSQAPASQGEPAIAVRDLTRRFGAFTAVNGVSFSVRRGEIFGFLGPNGSGKTTTIRMICGILAPTSGQASVLGLDVADRPEAVRAHTGYMSQRFGLYGDLTAAENLEFYGGMYGVAGRELRERRDELIAMAGLRGRERSLAADLSGGWRQRLGLGCALMHRPSVLLLDEPTGGVDPASRRDFWDLIYHLAAEGVTILVTTHYMDEAEHCDRIALLHDSRLIATGSPDELKRGLPGVLVEVRAAPLDAALRTLSRWTPSLYGTALHLSLRSDDEITQVRAALVNAGLPDATVAPIAPSLEDVFLALVIPTTENAA